MKTHLSNKRENRIARELSGEGIKVRFLSYGSIVVETSSAKARRRYANGIRNRILHRLTKTVIAMGRQPNIKVTPMAFSHEGEYISLY